MKNDDKLIELLKEKYNIVIDDADYLALSCILPVIKTIRRFDADERKVVKIKQSKVDLYLQMLWQYGEVDYRYNGTYVKIRQDEECTGYDFKLYKENEEEDYMFYFGENVKSTPFYAIDYIFGIIGAE
jgi:hypothetical protein